MADVFGPVRDAAVADLLDRRRDTIEKLIAPGEFEMIVDRHGRTIIRLSLFADEEFIEAIANARLTVSIEPEGSVTHGQRDRSRLVNAER